MSEKKENEAFSLLKEIYEDGKAEINGRDYKFGKMTHKERKIIFGFHSGIADLIADRNYTFLDSVKFAQVEQLVFENVLFNDVQLSKLKNHWDEYPQDYLLFISTSLGVISYPFMSVGNIG